MTKFHAGSRVEFKTGDKVRINANDPGAYLASGGWLKFERESYPVGKEAVVGCSGKAYDGMGNVWLAYPDGRFGGLAPECLDLVTDDPAPEQGIDGEVRVTSETGGIKGQKQAMYHLIPVSALDQVAKHYGRGEAKYQTSEDGIPNFRKGYKWSLSFSAMMRHAWAFWRGEDIDPETGSHHLAAVCWHALTLLTFVEEFPQYDDRPDKAIQRHKEDQK